MDKPRVSVCVLAGEQSTQWVNPWLLSNLFQMSADSRFAVDVEVVMRRPVEHARNYCVVKARSIKADWLLMIDADQDFSTSPLQVLAEAESAGLDTVIGIPTMQWSGGANFTVNLKPLPGIPPKSSGFFPVDWIGTGAMFIHHRVWEAITGPWFRFICGDDELGTPTDGEDQYFCTRARKNGFTVWAHSMMMHHRKTADLTEVGNLVKTLQQQQQAQRPFTANDLVMRRT